MFPISHIFDRYIYHFYKKVFIFLQLCIFFRKFGHLPWLNRTHITTHKTIPP